MPKRIELKGIVGWDITEEGLKNELPKNGAKAVLYVDSEGGSVFEANRLFNLIKDHLKRYPNSLTVEYGALGASASSYFPMAVGVENISVRKNTTWMAHKAWSVAWGNSDDMMLEAEILDGLDRIIAGVYKDITGDSIDNILESMKNELWLIGGQSVVDAGFASKIIDDDNSETEEEIEPVAKSVINAKIKEAKNKLRDIEAKEDLNKWVAKINNSLLANKNESLPLPADGNIEEEDLTNMTLEEFKNQSPEAKAEFDLAVKNAIGEAVKNERERGAEILNLAGCAISENVLNAFKEGHSVGDFAVNEIKNQKEAQKKAGDSDLGGLKPTNQLPESEEKKEEKKENTAMNTMDKALDTLYGKKGDK